MIGDSIQERVNEEWTGPAIVVKWVLVADVITPDGQRTLWRSMLPDLPYWDRDGLLTAAMNDDNFVEEDTEDDPA